MAKALSILLPVLYAVLWIGGVVSHLLLRETPQGAGWTAPLFLAMAAAIAVNASRGDRQWLISAGAAGFFIEVLGVRTGWPFGRYEYNAGLQPQWLGVPLALACAWLVLLAYTQQLCLSRPKLAPLAALWMVALDLIVDPVATRTLGYWSWNATGAWFGVPFSNLAGWFAVSTLLLALAPPRRTRSHTVSLLGLSIVLFFGLIALAHGMYGISILALVLAAAHGLILRWTR